MDADALSEAAEILEEAYERFLDAYGALEDEGELNNPVMKKKLVRVDKCFKELVLYVNKDTRGAWYSASPPPTTSNPQ